MADSYNPMRLFADEVVKKLNEKIEALKFVGFAEVTTINQKSNGGYQAKVMISGATTATAFLDCMTSYVPTVGDWVILMYPKGSLPVIIGQAPAAENNITPGAGEAASVPWDGVTGKPSTYPSDYNSMTNKPTNYPTSWGTVSGKPSTFPPSAHTHNWSDITGEPNFVDVTGDTMQGDLNMGAHDLTNIDELWGRYGLIARSHDDWLRINEDGSHSNGNYFGSTIIRTDGELQVGGSGSTFRAAGGAFSYKGDQILRGYSGTVKCTYVVSDLLSANISFNISSGSNVRIICSPRWISGSASMSTIGATYVQDITTTSAAIKIYGKASGVWSSSSWIYVDWIAIPDV